MTSFRAAITDVCVSCGEKEIEKIEREKDGGKSAMHKYGNGRFGSPIQARLHIVTL